MTERVVILDGDDVFVPFRNGRMQGERIYFDLPSMCRGVGVEADDVIDRAAAAGTAPI